MTTFGAHAFVWSAEWTDQGAERALRGAADRGLDFVVATVRPELSR